MLPKKCTGFGSWFLRFFLGAGCPELIPEWKYEIRKA
jgi:hypothetical protein